MAQANLHVPPVHRHHSPRLLPLSLTVFKTAKLSNILISCAKFRTYTYTIYIYIYAHMWCAIVYCVWTNGSAVLHGPLASTQPTVEHNICAQSTDYDGHTQNTHVQCAHMIAWNGEPSHCWVANLTFRSNCVPHRCRVCTLQLLGSETTPSVRSPLETLTSHTHTKTNTNTTYNKHVL